MRLTVSIPENVYRASATLARRLGLSRSSLYSRAVEEFCDLHGDDPFVNPLIRENVEPILIEELSRLPAPAPLDPVPASTPDSVETPARTR